jgi:predicted anti-sigma-YlaC factor YlaD
MMLRHECTQLPDILGATAEGRELPSSLAAHLASCPSCREQVNAIAFVRGLADTPDAPHALPDPAVIWWKAQLLRRWQAERAASAPIERMHWVELAAGLASLAVFLAWQWRGLAALVARAVSAGASAAFAAPQSASPLALVLIAGGTASIGAMFFAALHRRLSGAAR